MDMPLFKLKQILKSRYGKGLELRPVMDIAMLSPTTESLVYGNDLYIPIVVSEQFLGTAVVPHGWELCEDNKKSIAQLVRMVLEPKLYMEFLERRESNLKTVTELEVTGQNLSLFGDDYATDFSEEGGIEDRSDLISDSNKSFNTSVIHLLGQNSQIVKKVALQIHEFSARWAFVPFEDVAQDIQSVLDLANLGGMTLYVSNIEALSLAHQELLAEYIQSPRQLDEPLVITASRMSMTELQLSLSNEVLLNHVAEVHLEVERAPLSSAVLRELLDLFFIRDEHQDLH